jgi:hypothetical protein
MWLDGLLDPGGKRSTCIQRGNMKIGLGKYYPQHIPISPSIPLHTARTAKESDWGKGRSFHFYKESTSEGYGTRI